MRILETAANIFLMPGTIVLNALGITIDEDGGIFRSMVNMLFWGTVLMPILLVVSFKLMP